MALWTLWIVSRKKGDEKRKVKKKEVTHWWDLERKVTINWIYWWRELDEYHGWKSRERERERKSGREKEKRGEKMMGGMGGRFLEWKKFSHRMILKVRERMIFRVRKDRDFWHQKEEEGGRRMRRKRNPVVLRERYVHWLLHNN